MGDSLEPDGQQDVETSVWCGGECVLAHFYTHSYVDILRSVAQRITCSKQRHL